MRVAELASKAISAIQLAKDNIPPHPTALLAELGAQTTQHWDKSEVPNLRAWDWEIDGNWSGLVPNNVSVDIVEAIESGNIANIDLDNIGYIGMWRAVLPSKKKFAWCAIPSMEHGEAEPGAIIEIGLDRIRIGWKQEDLDAMVRQGFEIIQKIVAEAA